MNGPFLAVFWFENVNAEALAKQTQDSELQARFTEIAQQLTASQDRIVQELIDAQGQPVDIGGYFHPNDEMVAKAMRPSSTLNAIIDAI